MRPTWREADESSGWWLLVAAVLLALTVGLALTGPGPARPVERQQPVSRAPSLIPTPRG